MTKYQFLLAAKQSGLLKFLGSEFGFPTHYGKWVDIYTFHLEHPKLSQLQVSIKCNISQSVVSEAYVFMKQEVTDTDIFLPAIADCLSRLNVVLLQSNSR